VLDLEKALAADAKAPAELRDALANYNKMPTADLAGKLPVFPLARYLADRGITGPAAADIAFCVAAFANGMTEDRIERALEGDYLSRDPSPTKRAAYIRRTMEKARRWTGR